MWPFEWSFADGAAWFGSALAVLCLFDGVMLGGLELALLTDRHVGFFQSPRDGDTHFIVLAADVLEALVECRATYDEDDGVWEGVCLDPGAPRWESGRGLRHPLGPRSPWACLCGPRLTQGCYRRPGLRPSSRFALPRSGRRR